MNTLQKLDEIKPILEVGKDSQEYLNEIIQEIDKFYDMAVASSSNIPIDDLYEIMFKTFETQGYKAGEVNNALTALRGMALTNDNYSTYKNSIIQKILELRSTVP